MYKHNKKALKRDPEFHEAFAQDILGLRLAFNLVNVSVSSFRQDEPFLQH